jgi:endonuclease YncB( thermonuclease family)
MAQGLLELKGTIDILQFWPENMSDGDTVTVTVDPDGFQFSPDPSHNEPFHVTHIFDEAVSQGSGTKKVIHNGKVTVRFEHSDSAELHYSAPIQGSRVYRQFTGETAATKLHDVVAFVTARPVPCKVRTAVDQPSDVFDTYGRMIGQIFIYPEGRELNLNYWMIQNGWAFPAIYNSAAPNEVTQVLQLADEARKSRLGVWSCMSNNLLNPDFSMLFRPHATPMPEDDIGPLVIPKLFRRQVLWHAQKEAHKFSGTFAHFLEKQKDGWVRTGDFLADQNIKPTARTRNLAELVDEHGIFMAAPADIVFFEKPSTLRDGKGKKITSWWKTPVTRETKHKVAA